MDGPVLLGGPIKPADGRVLERANRGDFRSFQTLRTHKLLQARDRLIAWVAHHDVGDDIPILDDH